MRALSVVAVLSLAVAGTPAFAQVGAGLPDVNQIPEAEVAALPHVTAALAKQIVERRPFASIAELHSLLTGAGLAAAQAAEVYAKAFVHVNLDTATPQELRLIPGVGARMAHELEEYRPWRGWAQFDREIGKYVDRAEVERLKRHVFIPLDLNTASQADFMTIPGVGKRMAHELEEYRPWKSREQFEKEIGKYVDAREVARLWRFVTIR